MLTAPDLEFAQFKSPKGSSAQGNPPQVRAPKLAALVLGTFEALQSALTIWIVSTTAPIPD